MASEVLVKKLEILVPKKLYDELEMIEKQTGIKKEDILMRALIKTIEEFKE